MGSGSPCGWEGSTYLGYLVLLALGTSQRTDEERNSQAPNQPSDPGVNNTSGSLILHHNSSTNVTMLNNEARHAAYNVTSIKDGSLMQSLLLGLLAKINCKITDAKLRNSYFTTKEKSK